MLNCYQGKVQIYPRQEKIEKVWLIGSPQEGDSDAKAGKNIANKYYLLQPELEKEDLYLSTNTTG